MKTIEEVNKYLIENRTDENGDVDLQGLVFPENVDFSRIKVGGDLCQNFQNVGNNLFQGHQTVGGDLYQNFQNVGGCLFQNCQTVGGNLFQDCQTAKGGMILQSHDGLEEGELGFWHRKKTLAEKVADSDLDEDLKKEILANLKGGENDPKKAR